MSTCANQHAIEVLRTRSRYVIELTVEILNTIARGLAFAGFDSVELSTGSILGQADPRSLAG